MAQGEAARRRLVAASGHLGDEAFARDSLSDDSGRVRASALGALARMGRLGVADVAAGLVDADPLVRRRACGVSAGTSAEELGALRDALEDPDPLVVEAACVALGDTAARVARGDPDGAMAVTALSRTATAHRDPLCREAAVAALGALGDPAGLPAILAGTTDKPAVRRRAVLALAPFGGDTVDAALERARHDRDWQVRQAAEDLSALS